MQNSVLRSIMTLVYWSQPSSVVLCIQMCDFSIRITSLYGSQPSFVAFACKTATLGQNYKSLWVPAFICGFCMQNSDFRIRIRSLYGSQTSPMVYCIQNSDFSTKIASLYGSQPSSVVLCITTATL